jgi:hypothetical protein
VLLDLTWSGNGARALGEVPLSPASPRLCVGHAGTGGDQGASRAVYIPQSGSNGEKRECQSSREASTETPFDPARRGVRLRWGGARPRFQAEEQRGSVKLTISAPRGRRAGNA